MTYITLADAEIWIAARVKCADRVGWDALQDADQTIALQEAEDIIDDLPLRGEKYDNTGVQAAEFPRIIDGVICGDEYENIVVPQHVKDAVCLEACARAQYGTGSRADLQKQGVQSFSIGKGQLQETFRPGAGREVLMSDRARRILRRYMGVECR